MLFFPAVLLGWLILPKKARTYWLLAASYYFYMSWNPKYAVLIAGSTLITWGCALLIERCGAPGERGKGAGKRGLILALGILSNLAILAVFKYGNFTLATIDRLMRVFGLGQLPGRLDLLLPVGISFYTFQALGYVIDVYRGEVGAEHDLFRYALFVSFFPQLVAGPIERSKNLLSQMRSIEEIRAFDPDRWASGGTLIVWGLFLKMVISDRASVPVDLVFDSLRMYGGTEIFLALVLFSLQIYCDFASYSIIAMGCARVLGFRLMENFRAPFLSRNISDFWARWHISLTSWFRDYLYIPLGGNRKGNARKLLNLFVVFLVSGLWHGAAWTFVIWGGLNGLYEVMHALTLPKRKALLSRLKVNTECMSFGLFQVLATDLLFVLSMSFFRAETFRDAVEILKRIVFRQDPWILLNGGLTSLGLSGAELNVLVICVVILFLADRVHAEKGLMIDSWLRTQNLWFRWAAVIFLILMIFVFGEYGPQFDAKQFIYFQF